MRKVWLLIIVLYVSEIRKLFGSSCTFGLGTCDVIMSSPEPRKPVFLLCAQNKVMETLANDSFWWGAFKATFSKKIDSIMTSHNSGWGFENTFSWFNVKTRRWKRIRATVFKRNYKKNILEKNW